MFSILGSYQHSLFGEVFYGVEHTHFYIKDFTNRGMEVTPRRVITMSEFNLDLSTESPAKYQIVEIQK